MTMKRCLQLPRASSLLCALLCLCSSNALAQGEGEQKELVELTPTQIATNNQAVLMLSETPPRTKEAIKLVEAALLMQGRGDLLYLTLGRAYQLDGQCEMAAKQFDEAARAPGVKGVPEDFVARQLEQYREELEVCKGSLLITCEPEDLELAIDDTPLECGEVTMLEPGTYAVAVSNAYTNDALTLPVQISGGKQTTSQVKLGKARPEVDVVTTPPTQGGVEAPGESVIEQSASKLRWRVMPQFGYGLVDAVIEPSQDILDDGGLDYYLAGRSQAIWLGLVARVLWGDAKVGYGLNFEGSAGTGLVSTRTIEEDVTGSGGADDEEVLIYDGGLRFSLQGQVWLKEKFGLYVEGALRPAWFNKNDDDFGVYGGTLGGGVRGEFGAALGIPGLEVYAGLFAPLSGQLDATHDRDNSVTVLPVQAGLRVQPYKGLTLRVHFEGWAGEGIYYYDGDSTEFADLVDRNDDANVRAQQVMVWLGWTFDD